MKRYLLAALLFVCFIPAKAQHINFQDMISLVGAPTEQINQFLTVGKKFQFISTDFTSGRPVNRYQNRFGEDGYRETVTTGMGNIQQGSSEVLHVLSYTTTSITHIKELINQITKYGYHLNFKGTDDTKTIRIYEGDLYSIAVYIPLGHGYNTVEVHEKRIISLDN